MIIVAGFRRERGQKSHCVVDQHAGGKALLVDLDAAAIGLGFWLAINAGGLERGGVGDQRMTVGAAKDDRPIPGDGIEVLPGRETRLGPVGFDPAPAAAAVWPAGAFAAASPTTFTSSAMEAT